MNFFARQAAAVGEMWQNRSDPAVVREISRVVWRASLALSGALIAGALAYGTYMFFLALEEPVLLESAAAPSKDILDPHELDEVLRAFGSRRANYELLQSRPPIVADPSE